MEKARAAKEITKWIKKRPREAGRQRNSSAEDTRTGAAAEQGTGLLARKRRGRRREVVVADAATAPGAVARRISRGKEAEKTPDAVAKETPGAMAEERSGPVAGNRKSAAAVETAGEKDGAVPGNGSGTVSKRRTSPPTQEQGKSRAQRRRKHPSRRQGEEPGQGPRQQPLLRMIVRPAALAAPG